MNTLKFTINLLAIFTILLFIGVAALAQDTETQPRKEGWFYADEHPDIVAALESSEFKDGVLAALTDAGKNWIELWDGLDNMVGQHREDGCWMLTNMPHLDRLEMSKLTFIEHVNFAWLTKSDLPYDVPEDLFREYILTYRIGDEPVRPYRSDIWWQYKNALVGATPAETARNINLWVNENLTTRERGFFGPRPDPISIIKSGTGTSNDIAVVAIAMCKTFGVPARRARVEVLGEEKGGKTWLEIFSEGNWIPMYPENPDAFGDFSYVEQGHTRNVTLVRVESAFDFEQVTSNYTDVSTLTVNFARNGEYVPDYEHFTVSVWNDGAWLPIDDIWYGTDQPGDDGFRMVLGNGFYVVQVGVRNSRGDAWVQTRPVIMDSNDTNTIVFNLDIPASESSEVEMKSRAIDPLPEIDLNYANPGSPAQFPPYFDTDTYKCVMIFDPVGEPSIRMAPIVSEWCANNGVELIGIGVGDTLAGQALFDGLPTTDGASRVFYGDPDGTSTSAFGVTPNDEGAWHRLPLVILFSPDMEIILLQEGLNLSIGELLPRAIELHEEGSVTG